MSNNICKKCGEEAQKKVANSENNIEDICNRCYYDSKFEEWFDIKLN